MRDIHEDKCFGFTVQIPLPPPLELFLYMPLDVIRVEFTQYTNVHYNFTTAYSTFKIY